MSLFQGRHYFRRLYFHIVHLLRNLFIVFGTSLETLLIAYGDARLRWNKRVSRKMRPGDVIERPG